MRPSTRASTGWRKRPSAAASRASWSPCTTRVRRSAPSAATATRWRSSCSRRTGPRSTARTSTSPQAGGRSSSRPTTWQRPRASWRHGRVIATAVSDEQRVKLEWLKCSRSFGYFADTYCHIYDATAGDWVPFRLWPAQHEVARLLVDRLLVIILKARQLGLTWLVLAFALWLMLYRPAATVLLFSRRDDEAVHLLDDRLKGMYRRLPEWMHVREVLTDSGHTWQLSNGSEARAFPTTAGDSYTATLAIVDEADLVPDLGRLM